MAAIAAQADTALTYNVEWRLVHAGDVRLSWQPKQTQKAGDATLHVESSGMVSRLYKVNNQYHVSMSEPFCAISAGMKANEGSRQRETSVNYDQQRHRAFFIERDLVKNSVIAEKNVEIPNCVHDVVGGLMALRTMKIELGQSATIPISDGKKFAQVKVEAQEKEVIRTPTGTYQTTRYEVFLMNDVIYSRSGRVFIWLSDDDRRLPVQIRVRLQILIGTITLQLAKEEK